MLITSIIIRIVRRAVGRNLDDNTATSTVISPLAVAVSAVPIPSKPDTGRERRKASPAILIATARDKSASALNKHSVYIRKAYRQKLRILDTVSYEGYILS
ncbi:hypothetical protein ACMFMG_006954 [Clarireedia jacksonii]